MEELKPLEQVTEPDFRNSIRRITLPLLHRIANETHLSATVPANVQSQFAIAKNAYVYSWFYYPFQTVALLFSFLAIELALSIRVREANQEMFDSAREPTLYPLLRYALQQRWLLDDGFDLEARGDLAVSEKIAKQYPNIPRDQRYSYNLLDVLVGLRNDLAHGELMIGPGMGPLLARGAELINQLFPTPGGKSLQV